MKEAWPDTASETQRKQGKLNRRLYTNLSEAEFELERRSTILQLAPSGAAYDSAWKRYMGAFDAHANCVTALRRNHCHVG